MNYKELLKYGETLLQGEDAALEAWFLFSELFQVDRAGYVLRMNQEAEETAQQQYLAMLKRRLSGEPVAYILGNWEFMGLPFKVGPAVLTPRPDTETLVEAVIDWSRAKKTPIQIADLCTGSGQTLLLTAGKLAGMALKLISQTNQLQHVRHTLLDLPLTGTDDTHGKGHIFIHGHIGNQTEVLEHDTDGAAQIGHFTLSDALQRVAVDMNSAGSRLYLTGDELDNGGLTGTGRTHQEAELTVFYLGGNTFQGFVTLGIGLYYISKFYHIHLSPVLGRTQYSSRSVTEL